MATPTLAVSSVTQSTITLTSDYTYSSGAGVEVRIAKSVDDLSLVAPVLLPYNSEKKIVLKDLASEKTYVIDARFIVGSTKSDRSDPVITATADVDALTSDEKLRLVRKRMELLRTVLASTDSLTNVSVDGISETWVSRAEILKELSDLEAEESRLVSGGSRIRRIDMRRIF